MQGFNFGLRQSALDNVEEVGSRNVPSSVYSGAVGESRVPSTAVPFTPMALGGPFQEERPRYNPVCGPESCLQNTDHDS